MLYYADIKEFEQTLQNEIEKYLVEEEKINN